MKDKEKLDKITRHQDYLNDRVKTLSKRLNEVKESKFENRKAFKTALSIIPTVSIAFITTLLTKNGLFVPELIAPLSLFGGLCIGDCIEYGLFTKTHDDMINEMSLACKDRREFSLTEELENAKSEAYINEVKRNQLLRDDVTEEIIDNKKKLNDFETSKDTLTHRLKELNTRIALNKTVDDYKNKRFAITKHVGLTLGWTLELVCAYLFIQAVCAGSIFNLSLLVPTIIGLGAYGNYNYQSYKTRMNIFNRNKKRLDNNKYINNQELREYQNEYINKLGHIGVIEEINREISENKRKELVEDPINKAISDDKVYQIIASEISYDDNIVVQEKGHSKILSKRRNNFR